MTYIFSVNCCEIFGVRVLKSNRVPFWGAGGGMQKNKSVPNRQRRAFPADIHHGHPREVACPRPPPFRAYCLLTKHIHSLDAIS